MAQDLQSPQRPNSIRGTVINGVTHEPIGRALVYTPDDRFARWTDSEGHFDYPLPKTVTDGSSFLLATGQNQSQYTFCCVQARKPGFLSDPNQSQGTEMALGSEPTITLIPEGLIKGRVALPSSDAAFGIVVEIFSRQVQDGTFRWVRGGTVQANSNGEFRFAELLPGEYKIVTHEFLDNDPSAMLPGGQLYGYPPVYFPGAMDFAVATAVQLKAGQTFEADLSPVRQPYYQVQIPVADEVENAAITVSLQGHESPGYSLGFNSQRHRIEGLLPSGNYLVSMESSGPNAASGTVSLTVSGGPTQGSSMVLSRHSSIQLNVTEDFLSKDWNTTSSWTDGKRTFEIHGPRLYLQANVEPVGDLDLQGGRSIRPPAGPDDDTLVIEDLAPGRYRLRPFSSRGYVASATANGVDLVQKPFVVMSGSAPAIDISLRDDFAEIDGLLTNLTAALDASAKPGYSVSWKPSAYIYLIPQPGGAGQYQQIGAGRDGKFYARNVPPGNYLILAFEKQQLNLPYRDLEAMRIYEPKGQTVRLAPGQKEKLELQIISGSE
ncbi:MAG: carboxypeptidase-like regulatory domain-containing protein [Silvibacterium sp.]